MNGIIAWFARNGVAANLLMVGILLVGLLTMGSLKQEVVPQVTVEAAQVTVAYPGAAPEEVEEGIVMRVEEAVQGLAGVDRVQSVANEGVGAVTVEFLDGEDRQELLDEIKQEIDRIDTFPEDAEEPQVELLEINNRVMAVAVWGDAERHDLRAAAEIVEDALIARPGISLVRLSNAPAFELSVEVSEERLRRHGLSFDEVVAAVRGWSLDLPGGNVRTRGGEILLRAKGQAYVAEDFARLPLRARPDGTRVLVGDVAEVRDGFEETDQSTRFNGHPAVMLNVFRVGKQDALSMAEVARAALEDARSRLPEGIRLTITGDDTEILRDRLDLMLRNGRAGLILVLISLALFLRLRLALWVTVGIPIALLGAITLLPWWDVSINLISLFAFIVVLGIVVDDAIVVAENVHEHRQRGKGGLQAAIEGAREVARPVVFAILTTIVAFLPMLFLPGTMGQFSSNIPVIVVAALIFSLVEALLILPAHLRHLPTDLATKRPGPWLRMQRAINRGLDLVIHRLYKPSLERALRWRYATLGAGVAVLLLVLGYVASGRIKFNFFPVIEADNVAVELTMPLGTPAEATRAAIERFERTARAMQEDFRTPDGQPVIRNITTSVGAQPWRTLQQSSTGGGVTLEARGGHLAEVNLELISAEVRERSAKGIAEEWRQRTGPVAGAEELTFLADLMASQGDVHLRLSSPDLDDLRAAAGALRERLSTVAGVTATRDSFRRGKRELRVDVTPEGAALGFSRLDVARQVRQGFHGEEAQSVQRGRNEVEVFVRYPEAARAELATLEDMRLRAPDGREAPFSLVARTEEGRGYSTIERVDRQRSIHVMADLDRTQTTPDRVLETLRAGFLPELIGRFRGMSYGLEGRQKEQKEFMDTLVRINVLALAGIFILLAVPLRSYAQPLIIMSAIPFGVIGAIGGHVLLGLDLAILSVVGIVALSGIVINDSLVLLDLVNREREAGVPLERAVRDAGVRRFRPILLTTMTTFLGLTPLLLEKSLQAQFLIPMAASVAFGIVFATLITLVLVPTLYLVLEDLNHLRRARLPF